MITRHVTEKEDLEREICVCLCLEREIGYSDQECRNNTGIVENKGERERERVWKNWIKRSYVMNIKNRKSAEVALGKKPNALEYK